MAARPSLLARVPADVSEIVRLAVARVGRPDQADVPASVLQTAALEQVVEHAALHRVQGCVHEALGHSASMRPEPLAQLAAARSAALVQHLQTVRLVRRVTDLLATADVSMVVIKGPVLAARAYGDPGLRTSLDLDVLVSRAHFATAIRTLEASGFELLYRNWPFLWNARAGELPLGGGPVTLDAHWHLMMGDYDRRSFALDPQSFLERSRDLEVGGVTMSTFDAVDTVLHVALHAAHSGGDRLVQLKDIERCLASEPIDYDELLHRARDARCHLPVAVALERARRTVAAAVPDGLVEALAGRTAIVADGLLTRMFPVESTGERATPATVAARCAVGSHRASFVRLGGMLTHWARTLRAPDRHLDEHDPTRLGAPTRPVGDEDDKARFLDWVSAG
jgi:hypothetical protein